MLRLGIVGCDTSHSVAFTQRLNHVGIGGEHWVEGARAVAAYAGPSAILEQAKIDAFVSQLRDYGVEIVERPDDLRGKVDAVLIEAVDGSVHAERALPFLEAGIPTFVDKPFATSVSDARRMLDAAERSGAPLFSASSLRYAPDVQAMKAGAHEHGGLRGCDTAGPASLHPRNPGLFHYGVHAVEMLYELMGPGCQSVRCASTPTSDLAVGVWSDGRIGTVRGIRDAAYAFTFTAVTAKKVVAQVVDATFIYRELLKCIVRTFEFRSAPLSPRELLEPVAFQQAALRSAQAGGEAVGLGL